MENFYWQSGREALPHRIYLAAEDVIHDSQASKGLPDRSILFERHLGVEVSPVSLTMILAPSADPMASDLDPIFEMWRYSFSQQPVIHTCENSEFSVQKIWNRPKECISDAAYRSCK